MLSRLQLSIRSILGLIIGFMGVLGLALALASGAVLQQHAFDNQRLSMQKLIRLKADDLLDKLMTHSTELGLSLQSHQAFQQAFVMRDIPVLNGLLRNQFHDYFVTTGLIKLEKLAVFDREYNQITEQHAEVSLFTSLSTACPQWIEQVSSRTGPERMKVMSGLCLDKMHSYHVALIPIGGLRLKGYLAVITDPSHNLIPMESALGMPLTIRQPDGTLLYQSQAWPRREAMRNSFLAEYGLRTEEGREVLSLVVADDIRPLYGYLPQTRMAVMTVATLVTLASIWLATLLLRQTTLRPLQRLTDHLHLLRRDRTQIGLKVRVSGTKEIRELADNFNDMTEELSKLYEALEEMAFTDQLTAMPNRNRFQERLQGFMHIHQTMHQPFALFMMDLDRFKAINDTLGHHIGDQLLKEVGRRLEQSLRGSDVVAHLDESEVCELAGDTIARLGGDEFAAILPDVSNAEHAGVAAHKLLKAMEAPFVIGDHKLLVTISIGVAVYPLQGVDRHDLMRKADVAMYHAKKTRQGYAYYDGAFDNNSLRHLTLERDLHNAIDAGQLLLHYQPKVDLLNGKVCGAEALVRWRHPELGMIPPDEFIGLAEQSGLIRPLSLWVLNRALQDCSAWRTQGHEIGVSVNLSAVNLRDRGLPTDIQQILESLSFDAPSLVLEITESAVMSDPAHALQILARLRDMGVRLSIDDFGTGHSSLSYIKRLPVDEIKVDKSFVRDMEQDSSDEAIIRSVVVLAQHLRLAVVAEGVENQSTCDRLATLGCKIVQGYHIARPMPAEDFQRWLRESPWGRGEQAPSVVNNTLALRRHQP